MICFVVKCGAILKKISVWWKASVVRAVCSAHWWCFLHFCSTFSAHSNLCTPETAMWVWYPRLYIISLSHTQSHLHPHTSYCTVKNIQHTLCLNSEHFFSGPCKFVLFFCSESVNIIRRKCNSIFFNFLFFFFWDNSALKRLQCHSGHIQDLKCVKLALGFGRKEANIGQQWSQWSVAQVEIYLFIYLPFNCVQFFYTIIEKKNNN